MIRSWITKLQDYMPKWKRAELAAASNGFQMVCRYEDHAGVTRVYGAYWAKIETI